MRTRAAQRGWAGLAGLLIALVVVTLLGRMVLQQMGVLNPHGSAASTPLSRQLAPADAAANGLGASSTPSLQAPLERARSVEALVQQQARDAAAHVERSTQ